MDAYFCLIPVSVVWNLSLYWLQKYFLVKWFCRNTLSSSVQLQCDLKPAEDPVKVPGDQKHAERRVGQAGVKLVTDEDVNKISME